MIGFLTAIHVIICILLVISILLQSSKGGGLAGMFGGGGGMGSVFGGRGAASFLAKVTMYLGIAFGVTSLTISLLRAKLNQTPKSVLEQVMEESPADVLPQASPAAEDLMPPVAEPTDN